MSSGTIFIQEEQLQIRLRLPLSREVTNRILINSGFEQFCEILKHNDAGLLRNIFYYCRCVVGINAK